MSQAHKRFDFSGKSLRALRPTDLSLWIVLTSLLATLATACGGAPVDQVDDAELVATTHQAIYAGKSDNDKSANGSVVSIKIGSGTSFELCTGALVAPNVVLTARHCVSKNITPTVSCDENGKSGNGDHLGDDEDPTSIHIFLGPNPKFGEAAEANGKAIVHPGGGVLCNADIALLVLDADITSIPPMPVRLGGLTQPSEKVRSVGFGQNDKHMPLGTRFRKDNVKLLAVGQAVSPSHTSLGSREFEVGLSICQGDSGGPAVSETSGAVIGVGSRGGSCTDDFGQVYTSTIGFSAMFDDAFALAGGAPILEEGTVSPSTDKGESSTATTDLPSGGYDKACAARIAGRDRTRPSRRSDAL